VSYNTFLYKYNISPYKPSSNIQAENISIYIYYDTVIDPNKNESIYIVNLESNFFTTSLLSTSSTDLLPLSLEEIKKNKDKCFKDERNFICSLITLIIFSQIKNDAIASITTEAIPQFFKEYILTIMDTLVHFTANWVFYVIHVNKVTITISSKLIQQNTYKQYVSAKKEALQAAIENNDEFLLFFTHICRHLQDVDPLIPYTNIKQLFNALSQVILKVVKHNLTQVLPQFCGIHKRPYKVCHSSEYFNNQCLNRTTHQQQIDKYIYFPSTLINSVTTSQLTLLTLMLTIYTLHGYTILKQSNIIIEPLSIHAKNVNTYTGTSSALILQMLNIII
jgi:hypothetical protein